MLVAKEKTLNRLPQSIVNRMESVPNHQPAATPTQTRPSTKSVPSTAINRISNYDFIARKFQKPPIGSTVKIRSIVSLEARTKPRKSIGENTLEGRESHWPPEMSLYRAYFVPGGVDPIGLDYQEWVETSGGMYVHTYTDGDWNNPSVWVSTEFIPWDKLPGTTKDEKLEALHNTNWRRFVVKEYVKGIGNQIATNIKIAGTIIIIASPIDEAVIGVYLAGRGFQLIRAGGGWRVIRSAGGAVDAAEGKKLIDEAIEAGYESKKTGGRGKGRQGEPGAEHTSDTSPSKLPGHQEGQTRGQKDRGDEKADCNRKYQR